MKTPVGRIEKLVSELCPDGVEYRELGAVCEFGKVGTDKKTIEGQKRVLLLNYMDVIKYSRITKDLLKMEVTATNAQFECCNIKRGDIFITPTSETKEDIGILMLPRFCGRLTIWDSGGFLEPPFVVYG